MNLTVENIETIRNLMSQASEASDHTGEAQSYNEGYNNAIDDVIDFLENVYDNQAAHTRARLAQAMWLAEQEIEILFMSAAEREQYLNLAAEREREQYLNNGSTT